MTLETAAGPLDELLHAAVGRSGDGTLVVSGHQDVLREAVLAVADAGGDAPGRVRLLGTEPALEEATDDFLVASNAADLVRDGSLVLRASDEDYLPAMVVGFGEGDDSVTTVSPLPGGDAVAVRTDAAESVTTVREALERSFERAAPYEVTAPGYDRLLSSLESAVGDGVGSDVAAVLEAEVTVRSSDSTLDELDTVLLMGGRNGAQLYELSAWAEELGLASRATMSARKRRLESAGLLATEKVSTDVGRPRQRLLLAAEGLRDAPPADLVRAARSVLVGE
ncbi:transcriptional regulator TbsP domain-containing protein [Halorarum salinum]|uniref:Uncharacterized protein n=1 Tax=Halorarum salinum TaxID=2743089 RepID=A0A7D5LDH3_9EURY|nr:DUF5821 family protein [Halobaculum salinum]QLG64293.1 hypothetical protein HUG12_21165 [Halobaculum salinum]